MKQYVSPDGLSIIGTLVLIKARADIEGINDDGTPEYDGNTEIWWDLQETVERNGSIVYLAEDGGGWVFDQLIAVEDQADDYAVNTNGD